MSKEKFVATYTSELVARYANDEAYMAYLRSVPWVRNGGLSGQPTPYILERLAMRMTDGMLAGTADKDGDAIKATCKALGIKHTYKAIKEFCAD